MAATKDKPASDLLVKALAQFQAPGEALDLGAGPLNDSRYLATRGWRVTAVDSEPMVPMLAKESGLPIDVVTETFENCALAADRFGLVTAMYALPFISPSLFKLTWEKISKSLKKDGVFSGNFFGDKDEWSQQQGKMTFLARAQVQELFEEWTVLHFEEREFDQMPAVGGKVKHWHTFEVIARR